MLSAKERCNPPQWKSALAAGSRIAPGQSMLSQGPRQPGSPSCKYEFVFLVITVMFLMVHAKEVQSPSDLNVTDCFIMCAVHVPLLRALHP